MKLPSAFTRSAVGLAVLLSSIADSAAAAVAIGPEFQVNSYTSGSGAPTSLWTPRATSSWPGRAAQDGTNYGIFASRLCCQRGAAPNFMSTPHYERTEPPQRAPGRRRRLRRGLAAQLQDGDSRRRVRQAVHQRRRQLGGEFQINVTTTESSQEPRSKSQSAPPARSSSPGTPTGRTDRPATACSPVASRATGTCRGGEFQVNIYNRNYQAHPDDRHGGRR